MWLEIETDRHLFLKISRIRFDQNVGNGLWDAWKIQMVLCQLGFAYILLAVKVKMRRCIEFE